METVRLYRLIEAGIPVFSLHAIQHSDGIPARGEFGLEVAQLILGHAQCDLTKLDSEVNTRTVVEVIERIG